MNRAEKLTELSARISAIPTMVFSSHERQEFIMSRFIGSLKVVLLSDNPSSDDIIRTLERAVEDEERRKV